MSKKAILGSFNAEKYWRNNRYTELPQFNDKNTENIILSMDELLFPICNKNDTLITRFKMDQSHKNYLNTIGFTFFNNDVNVQDSEKQSENCIFEILYEKHNDKYFTELLKDTIELDTYAVLPKMETVCKKYNINYDGPKSNVIKRVNSKIYSHELHDRLGLKKYGTVIRNSKELEDAGNKYLKTGLLIKDAYGVAGKGNILITSEKMLKRIIKHISSQEQQGFKTCFLIEPLLDKQLDFSTQLIIDKTGNYKIFSTQIIYNNGFSYLGSKSSDINFKTFLNSGKYFDIIIKTAEELFKDGYYGNVCIDSMVLKNNEIIPIVEINARKSMGLINYYLDKYLETFLLEGYFIFFNVGFQRDITMNDILNKLDKAGILFNPHNKEGIIPLSSNTIFINRDKDESYDPEKIFKGRFYITAAAENQIKRLDLINKTKETLNALNFKIYN